MTEKTNETIDPVRRTLATVIRGKPEAIEFALVGLLAGGHVLLEDVPGVGKTTLAKGLSRALGLDFARVQFTPDLLPTDVLGAGVLNPKDGTFSFQPGPVFHNLLLADEINRASPRTQSALLEAMNEGQVTIDGVTRMLPRPFFVIATQNPVDYHGTYPLPEAQLDRFLVRISLGYPAAAEELQLLLDRRVSDPLDAVEALLSTRELVELQERVRRVRVEEDMARYLLRLVEATRRHDDLSLGASPRATLALFRATQAKAFLEGREWAGPADGAEVAAAVLSHRLVLSNQARYGGKTTEQIVSDIVAATQVPT